MKSQLMTALSIVGVLGTATTAMAVNTDVLANVDQVTAGTATDTLLPDPAGTSAPASGDVPTATPAPVSTPEGSPATTPPGSTAPGAPSSNTGSSPAQAPAAQTPASPVVHGTSGGSGSRVAPAGTTSVTSPSSDHDEDEHEDHEEEHEEEHEEDDD